MKKNSEIPRLFGSYFLIVVIMCSSLPVVQAGFFDRFSRAGEADLEIKDMQIIPQETPGQDTIISFTVVNNGEKELKDILLTLDTNSSLGERQAEIEKLAPGESAQQEMRISYPNPGIYAPEIIIDKEGTLKESNEENNRVKEYMQLIPEEILMGNDLLIRDFWASESSSFVQGGTITIGFDIVNAGTSTLENVPVRISTGDSQPYRQFSIPLLTAGQVVEAVGSVSYSQYGHFIATVFIDPDNLFSETNEANNVKSYDMFISCTGSCDPDSNPTTCNQIYNLGGADRYYRAFLDAPLSQGYQGDCCGDDKYESFSYQICSADPKTDCTTDSTKILCCEKSGNARHSRSGIRANDCTEGNTCFSSTESFDVGNDGHTESCWWGAWYDPDMGSNHCAFFAGDCTEEEYWRNAQEGGQEGNCGYSIRWRAKGQSSVFGEYDAGTTFSCCGDDADEKLVIAPSQIQIAATKSISGMPGGMDTDNQGNPYIALYADGQVIRCPATLSEACTVLYSGLSHPEGLAVNKAGGGIVYVTDENGITKLNCQQASCSFALRKDYWAYAPTDITTDKQGYVYTVYSDIIYKLDANLNILSQKDLGTNSALWGLDTDRNGYIYTATYQDNRILKLDPEFNIIKEFGFTSYPSEETTHSPLGVDVDDAGYLYAVEYLGNRAFKFHPSIGIDQKYWTFGSLDTPGCDSTHLTQPYKIRKTTNGTTNSIFITDRGCNRIIKLTETQNSNFPGKCCSANAFGLVNGQCTEACVDSTLVGTCTQGSQPQYCNADKTIVENCNQCGCLTGNQCDTTNNLCVPQNVNLRDVFYGKKCVEEQNSAFCTLVQDQQVKNTAYLDLAVATKNSAYCNSMSQSQQYCRDKVNAFTTQYLPTCGNGVCDSSYGEDAFDCRKDCSRLGNGEWASVVYGPAYDCEKDCMDFSSHEGSSYVTLKEYVDNNGDGYSYALVNPYPFGTSLAVFDELFSLYTNPNSDFIVEMDGYCVDNEYLVNTASACLTGGRWWFGTFITWLYVNETYSKTFNINVDDDYQLLIYTNCGEGEFTPGNCVMSSNSFRNGPTVTSYSKTLTKGWNVIFLGFIEDKGEERLKITSVSNLFRNDRHIGVMNSDGPIDNPNDPGAPKAEPRKASQQDAVESGEHTRRSSGTAPTQGTTPTQPTREMAGE
ncbi:MAG: CARDB domain-containing protein [Nanoarchaeota archaeon]